MVFLSFYSFFWRGQKYFVFLLVKHKVGFSMWGSPWISFLTVPLLKKHIHFQTCGGIRSPLGRPLLPNPEPHPSPCSEALRASALPSFSPRPRHLSCDWWTGAQSPVLQLRWTEYPVLTPWSLYLGLFLKPSSTLGQLVWNIWIEIVVFTVSPAQSNLSLEGWCFILPWE